MDTCNGVGVENVGTLLFKGHADVDQEDKTREKGRERGKGERRRTGSDRQDKTRLDRAIRLCH